MKEIIYTLLQTQISGMIKIELINSQGRAVGSRAHLEFPAQRRRADKTIPLKCNRCLTTETEVYYRKNHRKKVSVVRWLRRADSTGRTRTHCSALILVGIDLNILTNQS